MKSQVSTEDLRTGNHKAYELLFTQWYAPLCEYAFTILNNAMEAEDIVQKMFCKLWEQRSQVEIHTSIKSYLYRMVHNDSLNRIKQQKAREEHHQYLVSISNATIEDTSNMLIHNELEQKIKIAIENLPPRCREVFILSRYHYLSYSEIAEKLNIANHTVEKQITNALRLLRIELQDYLIIITILLTVFEKL